MRDDTKAERKQRIEGAAYELLAEKGYLATSMLSVAKRAKASNETLYRWYGDKQGLFRSLVESNADEVRRLLEADMGKESSPDGTLKALGPRLLSLLTGDRAITLNRAAAADPSGELATVLVQSGRETIVPLIVRAFVQARQAGALDFKDAGQAVALYLDLLIGDLQIRRVLGSIPAPGKSEIEHRANQALANLKILLAGNP